MQYKQDFYCPEGKKKLIKKYIGLSDHIRCPVVTVPKGNPKGVDSISGRIPANQQWGAVCLISRKGNHAAGTRLECGYSDVMSKDVGRISEHA